MDECMNSIWPRRNPDRYRITKINEIRRSILNRIDDASRDIDDLLEYWLQAEADYIKDIILKDLWKQEAGLSKLLCDANPDIKEAQWITSEWESEWESSTITCPECWRSWDKQNTCPDCGYEFNSDKDKQDA